MARWHALSPESRETFWRSLQTLNFTRVVIALVLLLYLTFSGASAERSGYALYAETGATYLVLAIGFALLTHRWRHRFLLQLSAQIAIDIGIISILYLAGGGARSGLVILYLFP